MKKLSYPQIDNIDLWDRIVSHKQGKSKVKLLPLREKIKSRYAFYETHFNSLDEILPLPCVEWCGAEHELRSCYGDNIEFNKTRQMLINSMSMTNQTKCPYCMLNRPNTLDHYFDKNNYPEFSAFIPNLVPCCSECNNCKSTSVFDECGNRKYIHFYHDQIQKEKFLFVRFYSSEQDTIPIVEITLKFQESNYISSLVERHFAYLSLISKYRSVIQDRLAPVLDEIKMYKKTGSSADDIKTTLQCRYISLVEHYGCNYWEPCLYEGILNSTEFFNKFLADS